MFDRVIVVDWSANSTPKLGKDSIWIAASGGDRRDWTLNVPTRRQAVEVLRRVIVDEPQRTLLAVDFSLGYPTGTAAALGLSGTPWSSMWALLAEQVDDDRNNRNNRFEVAHELNERIGAGPGPFWGCPPSRHTDSLTRTKVDPFPLPAWRLSEVALRMRGYHPFSCWQLLGAGAVGSQSLLGIAALRRLVSELAADEIGTRIWPFTTGLAPVQVPDGGVLVAEVWPSMIPVDDRGRVHDEAQVATMAQTLTGLDEAGRLDGLFAPDVPTGTEATICDEEGWVLGAGTPLAGR